MHYDKKRVENIESEFYEIDEANKLVHMKLDFASPNDLFDMNSVTKKPIFNDDFLEWIEYAFEYTPKKCKIDLEIEFDDMAGYTYEELEDIFLANTILEFKRSARKNNRRNSIGFLLIGIGLLLFVLMMVLTRLWGGESLGKEIFSYVADIAVTVFFWEAMTILLVDNTERRRYTKSLSKKFAKVGFKKKE